MTRQQGFECDGVAVCRSVLGDVPSSDDAFQATFLILVKKARAVQVQDSLGRWLHGVSRRVAIRASKRDALARKRASGDPRHLASFNIDEEDRREVRAAIHGEVNRLPASFRAPILACYFEGLTHEQAAAHLRWPVGTVKGRLSRARRMLRDRLTRRGIGITTGLIMATLSYPSAKAAVPLSLIKSTVKAAIGFAARNSVAYYVLGMVKTPGRFPIDENLTVLDALQRSGGLNKIERNDAAIRLVREAVNGKKPQTLSIDLRGIMTFGDTTTNYQILPGDRLYVYSMESFKEGAESSTLSTNPPK